VRVQDLERRLEIFQQDERLTRVSARLEPSEQRGESVLRLDVEEAFPLRLGLEWSNDVPPSLGDQAARIDARLAGPLRVGDELFGDVRISKGLVDAEGGYGVPVNRFDTRLEGRVRWSDGEVVQDPFEDDQVVSEVFTAGVGVSQPLWRTRSDEVRVALIGEWRRSQTDLFDDGISYPGSGSNSEGQSTLSVLRIGGEWVHRARTRVLAVRQLVSVGLPILDASVNPRGEPDRDFGSFLTQLRAAQRFERLYGIELVMRGDLQLATEPLMPMEQIGVGGVSSVRGYRENEMVRDQAVFGGVEVRVPVFRNDERGHLVQLAPFFDAGYGWSASEREKPPDTQEAFGSKSLLGLGIGVRYRYRDWLGAELYWGGALSHVPKPPSDTLQDDGIYFRVGVDLP
jgi:hemolysin activation/secretion protein